MSDLYDLKTFFLLGQYQAAINEGGKVKPRDEIGRIERDIFVYRAFIEQGSFQVVLDELKDDRVPPPLLAVRLLASYLSGKTGQEAVVEQADTWTRDPDFAHDDMVLLMLAIIYERVGLTQKAMQCVFSNKLLEAYVLLEAPLRRSPLLPPFDPHLLPCCSLCISFHDPFKELAF